MAGVEIGEIVHRGHHGVGRGHRPVGWRGWEQPCSLLVETGGDRAGGREQSVQFGVSVAVVREQSGEVSRVLVRTVWTLSLTGRHQGVEIKLVGVSLAVDLGHNVLVVVVPQGPAHLVVVHVRFGLPLAPFPRHLVRVRELELPAGSLPGDDVGVG